MLYSDVRCFERKWKPFNSEPYTSYQLLKLADHLGILTYTDSTIPGGAAGNWKGRRLIAYNPHQTESLLVLTIGHEIAHHVLGHIHPRYSPRYADIFNKRDREEKEAGIIGFLMWLPTPELCRMECHDRLRLDELYNYTKWSDPDLTEAEALKLCTSRISIFQALKRLERRFPAARQTLLPFPRRQTMLPGI